MKYVFIAYLLWNFFVFLAYGWDKRKAIKDRWRTPESTLILMALCMGAVGAMLGMKVFRHKTKHTKFTIGVPVCLVVNILLAVLFYKYVYTAPLMSVLFFHK